MKLIIRTILITIVFFAVQFSWAQDNVTKWADILFVAHNNAGAIPVISIAMPGLDLPTAYRIQKSYVQKRLISDKISGFKAGLTTKSGQEKFGVKAPLAGILFESGRKLNNATIDKSTFKDLRIETEIGFVIGKAINEPIKDINEFVKYVKAIVPVIELPDLGFTDMENLKGVDIISANFASSQYIIGEEKSINGFNVNSINVSLTLNDEMINQGQAKDAMGDQWVAAQWLVYMITQQGWTIEPGNVIITGAMGEMLQGKMGKYNADFGGLGKISFVVK